MFCGKAQLFPVFEVFSWAQNRTNRMSISCGKTAKKCKIGVIGIGPKSRFPGSGACRRPVVPSPASTPIVYGSIPAARGLVACFGSVARQKGLKPHFRGSKRVFCRCLTSRCQRLSVDRSWLPGRPVTLPTCRLPRRGRPGRGRRPAAAQMVHCNRLSFDFVPWPATACGNPPSGGRRPATGGGARTASHRGEKAS
jgi:hypothetical protein